MTDFVSADTMFASLSCTGRALQDRLTLMRDRRRRFLADRLHLGEATQTKRLQYRRHLARRDQFRDAMARRWSRLEAVGAPADIQDEALDLRDWPDDRRKVRRHVADAGPLAQHLHAAQAREQLQRVCRRVLQE